MTALSPAPKPESRVRAPRPLKRSWFRRAADAVQSLVRRTPVKARRSTPRRKAHPANRALRHFVASQPCVLSTVEHSGLLCVGRSDAHHVRTRGAGGGELANLISLCRTHHSELHQIGRKSFAAKYGVNLVELAQAYTLRWAIETEQPVATVWGAAPDAEPAR